MGGTPDTALLCRFRTVSFVYKQYAMHVIANGGSSMIDYLDLSQSASRHENFSLAVPPRNRYTFES